MLNDVCPEELLFQGDSQSYTQVDSLEEYEWDNKCPSRDGNRTQELDTQQIESSSLIITSWG